MEPLPIFTLLYDSPVGKLRICATPAYISDILFNGVSDSCDLESPSQQPAIMQQCIRQLDEYFNGERQQFDVPVYQNGSKFQQKVWNELTKIPFGKTISYLELARRLGDVKSIRAAASANGKNKISVIVPCHRVIGSNSDLVGYAGGLPNKRWLLEHEGKLAHGVQTLF